MTRTWAPEQTFEECARVLIRQHLVAQISEGLIVLRALMEPCDGAGWRHHPCVRMWRGYEVAFCAYGLAMCAEASGRGYAADLAAGQYRAARYQLRSEGAPWMLPWWWGGDFHAVDRATLVARFPEHYGPLWPDVEPLDEVRWPVPFVPNDHECR